MKSVFHARLKFITLNLWFGGMLFDNILDFLKKEKPDILVCQEVYNGQNQGLERRYRSVEVLKRELGFSGAFFSLAFYDNWGGIGKVENGNAIFSKFPIISKRTVFFDVKFDKNYVRQEGADPTFISRNMQQAVLKVNGKKMNILNLQGIWGRDGEDNERRQDMSRAIIKEIKGKESVILAGDFNVNQGTKTIADIGEHLREIFKDELVSTFNLKRKPKPSGYDKAVVDRIFASHDIKVIEHRCPQIDVSDHLPLVCVLDI